MSANEAFNTLKNYFETRPAAGQALGSLKEGVEIGVIIGGIVDCALYQQGGSPKLEQRPAQSPDVVFHIRPESVYVLSNHPSEDVGEIGVNILKEMLAGNIEVRVPGSFINILRNGYVDIIKRGGNKFSAFLARHGLSSFSKIIGAIKKMKG